MRAGLVLVLVWLLVSFGSARAQTCPNEIGKTCDFVIPQTVGPGPQTARSSTSYHLALGWIIETATLVPGWDPRFKASIETNPSDAVNPQPVMNTLLDALNAVDDALKRRPVLTPTGDVFLGGADWVRAPLVKAINDLRAIEQKPWRRVFRVNALFAPNCQRCSYTFNVRVHARYIGTSAGELLPPITRAVQARLETLPRRIRLDNRCGRPVAVRVAVRKVGTNVFGAVFSDVLVVTPGTPGYASRAAGATVMSWMKDWDLALQFPASENLNEIKGRLNIGTATLWDGKQGQAVVLWPWQVGPEEALFTLCPS